MPDFYIYEAIDYNENPCEIEIDNHNPAYFGQLPDTTSILRLRGNHFQGSNFQYLPRNLKELYIETTRCKFTKEDIKQLPRLHVFHVSTYVSIAVELLEHLPNSIYDISIQGAGSYLDVDILRYFPKTLRNLEIGLHIRPYSRIYTPVNKLLPHLKKLILYESEITNEAIADLPRNLTHLSVTGDISLHAGWTQLLPPDIKYIEFQDEGLDKKMCYELKDNSEKFHLEEISEDAFGYNRNIDYYDSGSDYDYDSDYDSDYDPELEFDFTDIDIEAECTIAAAA